MRWKMHLPLRDHRISNLSPSIRMELWGIVVLPPARHPSVSWSMSNPWGWDRGRITWRSISLRGLTVHSAAYNAVLRELASICDPVHHAMHNEE